MFTYYLNLALHSLKRNKVLTALMVLAIAVGIGASMTTLTVMHLLSGDPLPGSSGTIFYPQVNPAPTADANHGPYDVMDYRSAVDLWSAHRADRQALLIEGSIKLRAPGVSVPALMVPMLATTADLFSMFKVPLQYGHLWAAQDDAQRARVVVISADLNNKLFGGEDSVGRTLRLRDKDLRIVGVLKSWRPSPLFYDVAAGNYSSGQTSYLYRKPQNVFIPFSTGLDINDGNFDWFTCWGMQQADSHEQGMGTAVGAAEQ